MSDPVRFVSRGQVVTVGPDVPHTMTVLDYLRLRLRRMGTKEGCAEGDCGACTVVIGEPADDRLRYRAVNACILFIHQLDGKALFTVDDLDDGGILHPVQQAMVDAHASQCGFCTPGFVMSLFAYFHDHDGAPDDESLKDALAGNLCRCTGYRPILEAGHRMVELAKDDRFTAMETALLAQLASLKRDRMLRHSTAAGEFLAPRSITELAETLDSLPAGDSWILAGGTDVGLWVTKRQRQPRSMIYLGRVPELQHIKDHGDDIEIGACVTYSDALAAIQNLHPDFAAMVRRLGSVQIRNSGTIGGNIANGSPIGDSMPALIALGATVNLRSKAGSRSLALEDFYLGYRTTDLQPGEVVESVTVRKPQPDSRFAVYKLSKRFDQDISAVLAAFHVVMDGDVVASARLAFGGMAAIPARARRTEAALTGRRLGDIEPAVAALAEDFQPLSDMRASAEYRLLATQNLLRKFCIEAGTGRKIRLEAAE